MHDDKMQEEAERAAVRYLRSLPAAVPPPRLKARIAGRLRWRRRRLPLLAAAAVITMAALLPIRGIQHGPAGPMLADAERAMLLAEIRRLDRELQAAYAVAGLREVPGRADRVDALWVERADALRQLEDPSTAPPAAPRLIRL
jgi:hypothetical protein